MKAVKMLILLLLLVLPFTASAEGVGAYDRLCAEAALNSAEATAWLEIPGAGICYPVMQSAADDSFYQSRNAYGEENESGALYTQAKYNAADFSDPVTVIYGKQRPDGTMFGMLQEKFSGSFEQCRQILLHLPDGTLEYTAFAAVPYSSTHILHYYDFQSERRYASFFEGVYSTRKLGMNLDPELRPEPGDRVLILSTGLMGDKTQRYLVMAKLNEEGVQ